MEKQHLSELLRKYVNGECTPEEINLIDKWYLSHEENADDDRLIDIYERGNLERKMLERIKANVQPATGIQRSLSPGIVWYRAAAAVIILIVGGLGVYISNQQSLFINEPAGIPSQTISKFTNDTNDVIEKILSDGTVIQLHPSGSIEYPEIFAVNKREVVLKGEAFFDVTKDKYRPFIINTGEVTVRVLGTSFNVRAYEGDKEISVAVVTGKVSVYAKGHVVGTAKNSDDKEIILTPNQEAVYNTVNENFSTKIVDDPQIILENPTLFAMEYDATPVARLFQVIEENYGIDIVYDEKVLSACSLTTSMAEEGLYERMEIICQAIGAKYEVRDAKIIVTSDGCQ